MSEPTDLELATAFVAALYAVTNGRPSQFWGIGECAARAGIRAARDIDRAVHEAEITGLVVVAAGGTQARLTQRGRLRVFKK